jgi:hypothetical protein
MSLKLLMPLIMLTLIYDFQVVMFPNTHTHTHTHTQTRAHTHTIVVDCIRKSSLIAEEVMKKYTCLKYILYIYFHIYTHTHIYIYTHTHTHPHTQYCFHVFHYIYKYV